MADGRKSERASVSRAKSVKEMGDFWDTHSLADCWDKTRQACFEVRPVRGKRVALDPEVYSEVEALAHARGLSAETLVNLWIVEHLRRGKRSQTALQDRVRAGAAR